VFLDTRGYSYGFIRRRSHFFFFYKLWLIRKHETDRYRRIICKTTKTDFAFRRFGRTILLLVTFRANKIGARAREPRPASTRSCSRQISDDFGRFRTVCRGKSPAQTHTSTRRPAVLQTETSQSCNPNGEENRAQVRGGRPLVPFGFGRCADRVRTPSTVTSLVRVTVRARGPSSTATGDSYRFARAIPSRTNVPGLALRQTF